MNNTCNGHCSRCGECCVSVIPMTHKELSTIKRYVKKHNIKPYPLIDGNNIHVDKCPFYNREERKCMIYSVRPEVCKKFQCNLSSREIDLNRNYYDARADYNGNTGKLQPLQLLVYNDPTSLLLLAVYKFHADSEEKLECFLKLTHNEEILKAIKDGKIKLDWSDYNA